MLMGCLYRPLREQARFHIRPQSTVGARPAREGVGTATANIRQNCLHAPHPVKCRSPRFARGKTMSQTLDIAVIGATGTVGETLVQILEERDFPIGSLHLLASSESAGSSVPYRGKNVR